jgi:hypothetical protein
MNKKQLKKELEVTLVKTIEDLLISINPQATNEVSDIIYGASKILAKKFYKSMKHQQEKKQEPATKKVAVKKAAVKKAVVANKKAAKKVAKPVAKKSATPAKSKSKK